MGTRTPRHAEVGRLTLVDEPEIEVVLSIVSSGLSLVGTEADTLWAVGLWVEPEIEGPLVMSPVDVMALCKLLLATAVPMIDVAIGDDGRSSGRGGAT